MGGIGGGGNGREDQTLSSATPGMPNTGGGGGGARNVDPLGSSNGGSGVVIIRYFSPAYLEDNGACGSANKALYSSTPTTNLCSYGVPTAVSGTGPWTWSCVGESGSVSCSTSFLGTENNPGLSCKDILDQGYSKGDGVYWIDVDGGDITNKFNVYCNMTIDGGGWTLVWKNFGGMDNLSSVTRLSNYNLWASTGTSNMATPISEKVESSKNKDAWNYYIYQANKDWLVYDLAFNKSDNSLYGSPIIIKFEFGGNTYANMMNANISTQCVPLSYPIKAYNLSSGVSVPNGQTNYIFHYPAGDVTIYGSIGLANTTDTCSQSAGNLVTVSGGRHIFSYMHRKNDKDRVRCIRVCWTGSETVYEGREWYVR
jgi:hypothetical protein